MRKLWTLFLLFFAIQLVAQIDSLPPTDSLLLSLEQYHEKLLQAQLTEFQIAEKGSWLKYIPSVGLGYSLGTDNEGNLRNVLRPSLTYSTNVIYRVRQDKELKRAKIASIQRKSELEMETEKRTLKLLVKKYQNEVAELAFMERLNEIDLELYEIATVQFAAAEIAPSVYLPKKKAFLQKQFELFQKRTTIANLVTEVLLIAKYNL